VVFSDLVFIVGFMPMVLVLSVLAGRIGNRALAWLLFLASLGFYAAWRVENLPLLIGSLAFNYLAGQYLLARPSRPGLIVCVVLNLAPLAFFKYGGFAVANINAAFGASIAFDKPVLPLAISFFTFQQIMYLVDCYRRQVDRHGPLDYALFVTFFPHLIAGPLVQPKDMLHQWRDVDLRPTLERFGLGISIFAVGLFKKSFLADGLAPVVDLVFGRAAGGQVVSLFDAAVGTLGFAWQIYFDFSGYTDMAIGLAWFLRDYLYYPLGGNRRGLPRQCLNIMIVMLLGGLWHGAAWTFVVWGGLHGTAIVLNHLWRRFGPARIR
jgi:D-alanyl-lipoteichoic acid acyltransferase DltB (MBOAT superfamily)